MGSHFSEIVLVLVLLLMLGFVFLMNIQHNDSLAAKGMEFTGQALAALLTLMVASKNPTAPGTTQTTTTVVPPPVTPPTPVPPAGSTLGLTQPTPAEVKP
jgi:hypothetical protein